MGLPAILGLDTAAQCCLQAFTFMLLRLQSGGCTPKSQKGTKKQDRRSNARGHTASKLSYCARDLRVRFGIVAMSPKEPGNFLKSLIYQGKASRSISLTAMLSLGKDATLANLLDYHLCMRPGEVPPLETMLSWPWHPLQTVLLGTHRNQSHEKSNKNFRENRSAITFDSTGLNVFINLKAMSKSNYHKRTLGTQQLRPETLMMSYGYDPFLSEGAVKPPVFLTSTFAFRTAEEGADFFDVLAGRKPRPTEHSAGLIYSRFNHPNLEIVEDRLAVLDGAQAAVVTASGMAAISAVLWTFLRPGDQLVQSAPLYGGTETLISKILPEWGIGSHEVADVLSKAHFREAMETAAAKGTLRLCFMETPANPTNILVDLEALRSEVDAFALRHGYRPLIVCDNTLLGPVFQQPLLHGVDICVYSLTKYVGGHSDLVAGGVTGSSDVIAKVRASRSAFGLQLDPHSCWMISRSMETVVLRMQRAAATSSKIAKWLADNPYQKIRVLHPQQIQDEHYQAVYRRQCSGPGSTFSFVLDGGRERAFRFINALRLFKSAVSLGGTESLVCHPASTTQSGVKAELRAKAGISEGLVRVSIGLEHEDDLIADLENALKVC